MAVFPGFKPSLIEFLAELEQNNNRPWFAEHKADYLALVVEPVMDFVHAMQSPMFKVSKHFPVVAKQTGGSMMRIYRDARFSNNKTPYKTNVGIQFRHALGKDVHAPGFYVHLEPTGIFIGAGLWRPAPEALVKIRQAIVDRPKAWALASRAADFTKRFQLEGQQLKRPPRGFAADNPNIEDLKRKDFIGVQPLSMEQIYRKNFIAVISQSFVSSKAFMRFLCKALDVPF